MRFDIVVIGAGIHGAGAAQAAAADGYSVAVLEEHGIASATSSRSSKLIHGGLRYLETGQFGLVRQALHERAILLRVAPQLVRLIPFHIPVYADSARSALIVRAGLSLYAALGGLRAATRFTALRRALWPALDGLKSNDLHAVFRYFDAQTDDAALTLAVMNSAQTLGAEFLCPARFVAAHQDPGGYVVEYEHAGVGTQLFARGVINAAGPWVNHVLAGIHPRPSPRTIEWVQGAHLVVEGNLTQGAYYIEAPRDRRAVFVTPWHGHTLVGTTETSLHGDPRTARATPDETAYLLGTLAHYFPAHDLRVRESFAGVRVLPGTAQTPARRSRETWLQHDPAHPRLVSIYGGKLTTYRATGARTMALLRDTLGRKTARADTAQLPLAPAPPTTTP